MQSFPQASSLGLRTFAGNFATGVAVITARTRMSKCCGLTMNAVTSLSLTPPLYLICLDSRSNTLRAVLESKRFGVNFLASHQADLSKKFASKDPDKFSQVRYSLGQLGCPVLDEVVAACECRLKAVHPGGDHKIVIGKVEHIHISGGDPLVYHNGRFILQREAPRTQATTAEPKNAAAYAA